MAGRIVLNQVSCHGKGAIAEIGNEVQAHAFRKAFVCTDPDLVKFGTPKKPQYT
jgi:lactaldehyde reductase